MKKKLATWQLIKDSLQQSIPVMLLYVLESSGSSPGRQGFLMAVTAEGKMAGSIGGGMMEHKLVELAKENLLAGIASPQLKKQVHDKAAAKDQSGMICSGEQTVFLYPVQKKDRPNVNKILRCLQQNEKGGLVISPGGFALEEESLVQKNTFRYNRAGDWLYRENLHLKNQLYLIGGGHCSLALSGLMRNLDFYIHLFDHRPGLLTMQQNESAHEKTLLKDYSQLASLIPSGQNTYVVVMTFGYRTDDRALRALAGKEVAYLGLLGSKAKIEKMFSAYRHEGFAESWLQKIYAPIGLFIKSETPEEIAVSIAAQLILVKNTAVSAQ